MPNMPNVPKIWGFEKRTQIGETVPESGVDFLLDVFKMDNK